MASVTGDGSDRAAFATSAACTGNDRTSRFFPTVTSTVHSPSAEANSVTVTSAEDALRSATGGRSSAVLRDAGAFGALTGAAGALTGTPAARVAGATGLGAEFPVAAFAAGTGSGSYDRGFRARGGLTLVSSLGAQNMESREPAGLTWMNSPSVGSPTDTTLAEPPVGTPTAVGVNHTVDRVPADRSSRMAATSDSDSECTATTTPPTIA